MIAPRELTDIREFWMRKEFTKRAEIGDSMMRDTVADVRALLAALDAAHAKCEQLDQEACVAEARAEQAEQKLAAIRQLVTYDKPLIGEQPGTPRYVVKGCDVLKVLEEP